MSSQNSRFHQKYVLEDDKDVIIEDQNSSDHISAKEWVDSLKTGSCLTSDSINPDSGVKFDCPVWWVNFEVWDEDFGVWKPKGYAILDEDGNVLLIKMELLGNG